MRALELKIPPVALVLIVALAMWGASYYFPMQLPIPLQIRLISAIALATIGALISMAGVVSFHQVQTTVDPTTPRATSSLVSSGIYAYTRNPMYLGFLLILSGWACFLASALAPIGVGVFVQYMNRFQIKPEEQALADLFGDTYHTYQSNVRRWL